MEQPVMIVGAGPCGLSAAAFLAAYGVPCRIVDKKSGPTLTSNAVGMQARTLELFEELGITSQFLSAGLACPAADFYHAKKKLATLDFSAHVSSRYPFLCMIPQSQTERILLAYLEAHAVCVEYDTELTHVEQSLQHVLATLQKGDHVETVCADWLVAADGFHSTVRSLCDIRYVGDDFAYQFMMIDAPVDCESQQVDRMVLGVGHDMTVMSFPMKESSRLIAEVQHAPRYQVEPSQEVFQTMVNEVLPYRFHVGQPLWQSHFHVHEKLIATYQDKRVFFVGDAAHAHIPAAAQGMNTGMQDAINLSWKLAQVMKSYASPSLLQTYGVERRPVAQRVLKMTGMMGNTLLGAGFVLKCLLHVFVPLISRLQVIQRQITNTIAQLDVTYKGCGTTQGRGAKGVCPGDRVTALPVDRWGDRYLLIDYRGDCPLSWEETYPVKIVPASTVSQSQVPPLDDGYCVVRPDRYVGFVGCEREALLAYLVAYESR